MSKCIIAVGCSHVYGSYLDQSHHHNADDIKKCHERSWAHKLRKYFNGYKVINLATPGASNTRSLRLIKEYVLENLDNLNESIIFIGITDPSRIEVVSSIPVGEQDQHAQNKNYFINKLGSWSVPKNPYLKKFVELYYSLFYVEEYVKLQLNLEIITLHFFLKYFNLEHYFIGVLVSEDFFDENTVRYKVPIIGFKDNAIEHAKRNGYKVGKDLYPDIDCNHLNHDGNYFLSTEIFNKIQEIKNAK